MRSVGWHDEDGGRQAVRATPCTSKERGRAWSRREATRLCRAVSPPRRMAASGREPSARPGSMELRFTLQNECDAAAGREGHGRPAESHGGATRPTPGPIHTARCLSRSRAASLGARRSDVLRVVPGRHAETIAPKKWPTGATLARGSPKQCRACRARFALFWPVTAVFSQCTAIVKPVGRRCLPSP